MLSLEPPSASQNSQLQPQSLDAIKKEITTSFGAKDLVSFQLFLQECLIFLCNSNSEQFERKSKRLILEHVCFLGNSASVEQTLIILNECMNLISTDEAYLDDGEFVQLIPICLNSLSMQQHRLFKLTASENGEVHCFSAEQVQIGYLKNLLAVEWNENCVLPLLACIKECCVFDVVEREIVKKCISLLEKPFLEHLPELVYSVLLIVSSCSSLAPNDALYVKILDAICRTLECKNACNQSNSIVFMHLHYFFKSASISPSHVVKLLREKRKLSSALIGVAMIAANGLLSGEILSSLKGKIALSIFNFNKNQRLSIKAFPIDDCFQSAEEILQTILQSLEGTCDLVWIPILRLSLLLKEESQGEFVKQIFALLFQRIPQVIVQETCELLLLKEHSALGFRVFLHILHWNSQFLMQNLNWLVALLKASSKKSPIEPLIQAALSIYTCKNSYPLREWLYNNFHCLKDSFKILAFVLLICLEDYDDDVESSNHGKKWKIWPQISSFSTKNHIKILCILSKLCKPEYYECIESFFFGHFIQMNAKHLVKLEEPINIKLIAPYLHYLIRVPKTSQKFANFMNVFRKYLLNSSFEFFGYEEKAAVNCDKNAFILLALQDLYYILLFNLQDLSPQDTQLIHQKITQSDELLKEIQPERSQTQFISSRDFVSAKNIGFLSKKTVISIAHEGGNAGLLSVLHFIHHHLEKPSLSKIGANAKESSDILHAIFANLKLEKSNEFSDSDICLLLGIIEANLKNSKFLSFLPKLIENFHLSTLGFDLSLASSLGNRNLINSILLLDSANFSLSNAQVIASSYARLFGPLNSDDNGDASNANSSLICEFEWITMENSKYLLSLVFDTFTQIVANSSWIIRNTGKPANPNQLAKLTEIFQSASIFLHTLSTCALPINFGAVFFTCTRNFYQSLTLFLRLLHEFQHFQSDSLPLLVTQAMYRLAKAIYALIPWMQSIEVEIEQEQHQIHQLSKKKRSSNSRSSGSGAISTASGSSKNSFSRLLPDLIYQMEMCERVLVEFSKVSTTNLHRLVAKATSRDFKIKTEEMQIISAAQEMTATEEAQDSVSHAAGEVTTLMLVEEEEEE